MDSSSKHNPFPYKHDGDRQKTSSSIHLPINHNSLNEAKALNIARTMLGNFAKVTRTGNCTWEIWVTMLV